MRLLLLAAALSCGLSLHAAEARSTEAAAGAPPAAERLQWWREARFGLFIHWGPVSLKGTEIGWSRGGERRGYKSHGTQIPVEVYDNLYQQFNPTNFNADAVGGHRQGRGHEIPRLHQPAPRRLQRVRHPGGRLQDHLPQEPVPPRRGQGTGRRLPPRRAALRPLLLAAELASPGRLHRPPYQLPGLPEDAGARAADQLRPGGHLLVRRPGQDRQGLRRRGAEHHDPQAPAAHPHQQPRRPGRRTSTRPSRTSASSRTTAPGKAASPSATSGPGSRTTR